VLDLYHDLNQSTLHGSANKSKKWTKLHLYYAPLVEINKNHQNALLLVWILWQLSVRYCEWCKN